MKQTQPVEIVDIDPPASRLDSVIEWLLLVLLAFMPLAFGAVEAWSEMVVIFLAGLMMLCLALKLVIRRDSRLVWSWAYLPLALFGLLVVGQLTDLPTDILKVISGHTVTIKTDLLGDLPDASRQLATMKLSFYPQATVHNLRLFLAVAAVFFVVVNVYRRPDQIKRLLLGIAVIGGGLALLALAQYLLGNGKIYWLVPTYDNACSGTFINHSHYSQHMTLSIGAALGLLLVKLHESFHRREITIPQVIDRLNDPSLHQVWFCSGMIILAAATVFVCLSRGGMVSLLIATGFTAVVLAFKRGMEGRSWIITVMALASFICVLYLGFDAVYDRLATLQGIHVIEGRWQIVKDISIAWTKFPLFGTGLGTNQVVYPMFDRATTSHLASHAENEYAQLAEETGALGLLLILILTGIVWRSYIHNVRHTRLPIRSAAFGLGFGLLAVMIHSFSDFGQHLPANACLAAVTGGLLIALARRSANPDNPGNPARNQAVAAAGHLLPKIHLLRIVAGAGVIVIWGWALLGAHNTQLAEAYWKQARQIENDINQLQLPARNEDYTRLLARAQTARQYQPHNIEYNHWLNVYRWQAISRVSDQDTGDLVLTDQTLEFTGRIVAELHRGRALCPTYGASYCVAGQLEYFILNDPVGAEHIRQGYKLAPYDATTCFVAGLLDSRQGEYEDSLVKFKRAIKLDGSLREEVLDVYIYQVNRPDLAVQIARDDLGALSMVARKLSELTEHQELAETARQQVTQLLKEKCAQPDAPARSLATLAYVYYRDEDYHAAVEYYRQALALDYGNTDWRLSLARALTELDQLPEAIHEARICLRLRPQMTSAKRLIEELSVRN